MSTENEQPKVEQPTTPVTLVFDLQGAEMPFELKGLDQKFMKCKLVEISGTERDNYIQLLSNKSVRNQTGSVVSVDVIDLQAALLAVSARKYNEVKNIWERFTIEEVRQWPSTVQESLYEHANKLSGLDKAAKENALKK